MSSKMCLKGNKKFNSNFILCIFYVILWFWTENLLDSENPKKNNINILTMKKKIVKS